MDSTNFLRRKRLYSGKLGAKLKQRCALRAEATFSRYELACEK